MKYHKVDNFVVKLRAYPNTSQRKMIDEILHGVRVAYNVTAYEISKGNEMVTSISKDGSARFPDFVACGKKEWLNHLRANYEVVKCVPAAAMSSSAYGIFSIDMKKSWETSGKLPSGKWKPDYYSKKKPRRSFTTQVDSYNVAFKDDSKSVKIFISKLGFIKTRGWRFDVLFGDEPKYTFDEYYNKDNNKKLGATLSIDNCGDYWICLNLQTAWVPDKSSETRVPIGVDVGIKDLAITSEGDKFGNKKFKRVEKRHIRRLNRKMSRRWGWSNIKFRNAHKADTSIPVSKGYESSKLKHAKLERKIARRRDNWNHKVTTEIVRKASFIGIESLNVKGMMANRHLAYSASDAAMYDVLSRLRYKALNHDIPIVAIGRWEPSSQTCHVCGYVNKEVKNLSVREWVCPDCGTKHDRDVNAGINIRNKAMQMYAENPDIAEKKPVKKAKKKKIVKD